eukprot:CAMPEP_0180156078 /NCGR_PEP_ID=MMETSP0986-20121125/25311_1 /TAXON_ID=697907 /ORGANISM="non described non described, Strain CCMP2293" /LENGTH=65 /DNA_ID=CAMNT_0022105097 /DNA_START=100 /DNA_END=297 /DNA_ORIENTATION=-
MAITRVEFFTSSSSLLEVVDIFFIDSEMSSTLVSTCGTDTAFESARPFASTAHGRSIVMQKVLAL